MFSNPDRPLKTHSEAGAVLPISALIILLLLVFAAFAVDLGAAWAERRQDQTAADAAAMAGAIEYVRSNPTEAEVVALVKDYVERNIGYPATSAGWSTCPTPTDGFQPIGGNNCISLKQASTESSDTLFRVQLPKQPVETAFARVIGIDTIDVDAFAIAQIEKNQGVQGALPFVLPNNPGTEYCLGTPPSGQAREVCEGPSNGFFGSADSPFFGAAEDPWGTTSCADSPANNNTRIRWNSAIGIDHFLRIAPDSADPVAGADVCAATQDPSYIPYAIVADQGSLTQASDGFIGDPQFGSLTLPGRLRQTGGSPASWRPVPKGNGSISLDNVGLWEYLVHPANNGSPCSAAKFAGKTGTELTAQMVSCLQTPGDVKFSEALLQSPRFALIPQLDVDQAAIGAIGPNAKAAINIIKFVPVYLQATWYNCSAVECMYFDADDAPAIRPEVFEPGEGVDEGCVPQGGGCKNNVNLVMEGISAFVLDNPDWLPDSFDNQFNDPIPFNVFLYR